MYIEQRIEVLELASEDHHNRLDMLATGLAKLTIAVNEGFAEVRGDIRALENRVSRLEIRMDRIEQRMDRIEQRMDRIETRMDSMEAKLDMVIETLNVLIKRLP